MLPLLVLLSFGSFHVVRSKLYFWYRSRWNRRYNEDGDITITVQQLQEQLKGIHHYAVKCEILNSKRLALVDILHPLNPEINEKFMSLATVLGSSLDVKFRPSSNI